MTVTGETVASVLTSTFDPGEATTLERAVIRAAVSLGMDDAAAAEQAPRLVPRVRAALVGANQTALPFEILDGPRVRLVGKARRRPDDSSADRLIRARIHLKDALSTAVFNLGHQTFESICSRVMTASGASESFVTEAADEGGVDFYGRIAIRPASGDIRSGLATTTLFDRGILFLGQSKCVQPGTSIQRDDIQKFAGQVDDCVRQYEGFRQKPAHRVPEKYFRRGETHLSVYMTTGRFTGPATSAADASDVILVDGEAIAEFLLFVGAGIAEVDEPHVDPTMLRAWAYEVSGRDGKRGQVSARSATPTT